MIKGQTGRKWTRSVAFCWWKVSSETLQRQECPDLCYPLGSAISRAPGNHINNVFLFFLQWLSNSPSLLEAGGALSHCQFSYRCQQPPCSSCDIIPSPEIIPILPKTNVFFSKSRRNHDVLEHPSAAVWVNLSKVF